MLTYSNILIQVISIIVIAYILRYAKVFKWKQSWVIAFGVISITYLVFKTSNTMNIQFTTLEWFAISFINTIGWHMSFYCKEERRLSGIIITFLTPAIVLGLMF